MIDEGAQLRQDLALARMIKEDARCRAGKVLQHRFEFSLFYCAVGDGPRRLRQADALDRGP